MTARSSSAQRLAAQSGRVRIIGGTLRGSRLEVADSPGLRPTSDRVRETLFNWLTPHLAGRRCLDLFAGTGALGIEAASRGAAGVTLVERDPLLAAALRNNQQRLRVSAMEVVCADGLAWLRQAPRGPFGLIFLDPPFAAGLLPQALAAIEPHLHDDTLLYLEYANTGQAPVDRRWQLLREGNTRQVRFALYRRWDAGEAPAPDTLPGRIEPLAHGAE